MSAFQIPEWDGMFIPDVSLLESFLRASGVYLGILLLFRVVLRRQSGGIGLPDVMLAVLVSECVSQALGAEAKSIPNGLASVAALLFWSYTFDRLAYRWRWIERLLEPRSVPLIASGKVLEQNMSKEGITAEELASQLREHGVEDAARVHSAVLESDGCISVVEGQAPEMKEMREMLRTLLSEVRELRSNLSARDPKVVK